VPLYIFWKSLILVLLQKQPPNMETFDLSMLYALEFSMKMKKNLLKIDNSQRIALKMIGNATSL
jgi:hypothetical protein